jgi:SNF2 family DNA or RNA helicase
MPLDHELEQPAMFVGALKPYQLRGVTWLVSLYQQVHCAQSPVF